MDFLLLRSGFLRHHKRRGNEGCPYTSVVGSLIYVMLCTRLNICFEVGMVSKYHSNPGSTHCVVMKHILKYLQRTRNYMLVYHCEDLTTIGYTNSEFQLDCDSQKST